MKNVLLIINIVLVLAVGFLFYKLYSKPAEKSGALAVKPSAGKNDTSDFRIAYIELDSLTNQYEYAKEIRTYLRAKEEQNAKELNKIKNEYLSLLKEYQQKGQGMSQTEQSQYQEMLMRKQNEYNQAEQDKKQAWQAEYFGKLQDIKSKVQDFLKGFATEKGYAFVFASDESDNLYYKDKSRDVTREVIEYLNSQHKKK
jgi:outer membrane protein